MKQVDMDFDVAIKVETVDEICDKLITVQNQQHKHELANVKGSVAIKIEPHDDWCCESSLYVDQSSLYVDQSSLYVDQSSLYVDHQVKDEVVIGPTELRKQSEGSFQLPSDLACNICSKTFKHKSSFTRHMNTHNAPATSVEKCEPKLEKQSIMKKEKNVKAKSTMTRKKKVYKMADKNGEIKSVGFEGKSDNINLKQKVDNSQNKCLLCFKTFTIPNNLTRHMNQLHGERTVKIEPHDDWCCESSLYVDHQVKDEVVIGPTELRKQSEGSFQLPSDLACNICSKTFKHKSSFTRHMNTHNAPATSVEKCEPKLEKQSIMKKEKNVKAKSTMTRKKKVYKMADKNGEIKSVGFEGKSDNINLKQKVDNSQNKCLLCFKTFTIPNNLTRHMNQLHGERTGKPYSCDKCSMSFARSDYLIRHKLIKHADGKQVIFCKCGNKFYDKWTFTRHKKGYCLLKSSTLKLICDYCNKTFCNKYRLTEHIKKHLNNTYRILICEHCHKHFHRKCEIERHMFQHLGINLHKFKCQICNKKFTRNWSLKKHLISHTGRKPFACKYCMRSFGSKWGCVCHERKCHPM